jgi:hypothetical protein
MPTTMPTSGTRQDKINEREHAMKVLSKLITADTVIHTRTDYGKGQTDYVRVYVVAPDYEGRLEVSDVTYFVARATESRLTDKGLPLRGGGYSKGLDVFISTCHALGLPANQHRWREIH